VQLHIFTPSPPPPPKKFIEYVTEEFSLALYISKLAELRGH